MKEYIVPEINVILFNVEDGVLTDITSAESKNVLWNDILENEGTDVKVIQGVNIKDIGK